MMNKSDEWKSASDRTMRQMEVISSTGTQHGGHGLEENRTSQAVEDAKSAAQRHRPPPLDRLLDRCDPLPLRASLLAAAREARLLAPRPEGAGRKQIADALDMLRPAIRPADLDWITVRVTVLLSHGWVERDPVILEGILADWERMLAPYPAWAIERASLDVLAQPRPPRLWPGEIVTRCEALWRDYRLAEMILTRWLEDGQ